MSIAVLTQVYDEMRRLAIAGSNLASGDFRLKKLVPPLEQAGAKAPVFGKVAEGIQRLIDSSTKDSADALLELSTLVTAILYTQGETGAEGKLEAVETTDFGLPATNASARVLKPLLEALTSTGSGRQEVIVDAHRRGAFKDLRLVKPALEAIDDGYAEIADFVADNVLPLYGKAIYEDLKVAYDPKGKGGHVRRLRLMHRLDPEATHELVEQALESGSKEIKIAALECLGGSREALPYLLEQTKAKSAEVRAVALRGIAKFSDDEVVDTLMKALTGSDLEMAAGPANENRSPKLLQFLLDEGEKRLDEMLATKDKEKAKKLPTRFYHLLTCFASRDDKQTIAFLTKCFDRRAEIGKLKGETSGTEINRKVAALLARTGRPKAAVNTVIDAHETLEPEVLPVAMWAAVQSRKPKEVYDLFSPYYLAKTGKKKDAASQKREAIRDLLARQASSRRYWFYGARYHYDFDEFDDADETQKTAELDPRWLDAAIEADDLDLVQALARPKHKESREFLSRSFEELLKKKGELDYHASHILETMIRVEHPDVVDHYLDAIKRVASSKRGYYMYWLARLIPDLPASAAPKLEALLPELPEKLVDQIAPYLADLQAKSAKA